MAPAYETIEVRFEGPVATIRFILPDILNRMVEQTLVEFTDAIERLRRPGDVRALLISSTGRAFSAGGDIEETRRLAGDFDARQDAWDSGRRALYGMTELPMPVVVALHGDVYGLATSIVLSADIIVASRNARIGDPHVKMGLVAGDGGCAVWPIAFGLMRAKRHLLTGEPITAEEAYRLGAVSDLVDTPEETLPAAQALCDKLIALPPLAVQLTKKALNHLTRQRLAEVFDYSLAMEQYTMLSEDFLEAITAFKEKRTGQYRNR